MFIMSEAPMYPPCFGDATTSGTMAIRCVGEPVASIWVCRRTNRVQNSNTRGVLRKQPRQWGPPGSEVPRDPPRPRILPSVCLGSNHVREADHSVCRRTSRVHLRTNRVQNNDRWVCWGRNLVRNGDHLVPELPVIRQEPLRKLRHVRL